LGRTSLKASNTLVDNVHWGEIATLIRLILIGGNNSKMLSHNQLYVPEVIHLVTLVAGTGQIIVRKSVYGIVMNLLQSLYISRTEESTCPELLALINACTQPKTLQLFGLARLTASSEYTIFEPSSEKRQIDTQESLTALLVRIMEVTAGSNGLFSQSYKMLHLLTYS
jgi:neurofibromin 1